MKAVHVYVSGLVQGVGYRQGCRYAARSLDLVGWVRNLRDGRVELFAQGSDEAVDRLIDWVWAGPSTARVTGVESDVVTPDVTLTDFFIQPGPATIRGSDPPRSPRGPWAS
ncbi:MAG TPA: acylphosphatase [Acidimicrobiia bacterium]|nr:acylphosphatase [Acidimicrobiia bacterium]